MPFTKRQIDRILEPDLISADQIPHNGLRLTESYLRRKLFSWEDKAVTAQWRLFDAAHRRIQEYAIRQANLLGLDTLDRSLAAVQWRQAVQAFADAQIDAAIQQTAIDAFRASLTAWYAGYYGKAWQLDVNTKPEVMVSVPMPDQFAAHRAVLLPDLREQIEPDANLYAGLGQEWREAYEAEASDMKLRTRRALNRSLADETSVLAALLFIREGMGLADTPQDGFRQSFWRVQTLTRTAIVDGAQDGSEALWLANAEPEAPADRVSEPGVLLLSLVTWITARDERVCSICRPLDGQVSSLFDIFRQRPPAHPNCRCGEIPSIAQGLLTPDKEWPNQTWAEWLAGVGGGLILDEFLDGQLTSTQL